MQDPISNEKSFEGAIEASKNIPKKIKRGIFDPSILEHRERVAAAKPLAEPADVTFLDIVVPINGHVKLPVRIYLPKEKQERYPTLFYVPGTAFIANELRFTRVICSHICEKAKCQVIVINHRLAPESQFPKGFLDAYHIFKIFAKEMSDFYHIDTNRMAICGYSSGGTFAAQIAIQSKEENIQLRRQILVSPIVDLSRSLRGFEKFENQDTDISDQFVEWFLDLYIPEGANPKNPTMSPFWQPQRKFKGLPPTDIIMAEYDRFRGDAEYYFRKLQDANVDVSKFVAHDEKHSYLWYKLEIVEKIAERLECAFSMTSIPHAPSTHTLSFLEPRFALKNEEAKQHESRKQAMAKL